MEYNTKIVDYGDFLHIQHYQRTIKRVDFTYEEQKIQDKFDKVAIIDDKQEKPKEDQKDQEHSLQVSVNRSKNNLFHIARSNHWDMFVTLTFDQNGLYTEAVDSSDYDLVSKLVTSFFNKLRKDNPELKYLAVPELHKDKIHYHYHALISNIDKLDYTFSGHYTEDGDPIYNIEGWRFGFSQGTLIKDQGRVRNYIGKYICKDLMNKLKYKKRYYASQNVKLCEEEYYLCSVDDLYALYGDNIAYIKTIDVKGVNKIHYIEVKK